MKIPMILCLISCLLTYSTDLRGQIPPTEEIMDLRDAFEVYQRGRWGLVKVDPQPVAYVDTRFEVIIALKQSRALSLASQLRALVPSDSSRELTPDQSIRWAMSQVRPSIRLLPPNADSASQFAVQPGRVRDLVIELEPWGSEHLVYARFIPEHLLVVAGTIPDSSTMRIRLQVDERFLNAARVLTKSIPFENISLVAKTLTDRVSFTWAGKTTSLGDMHPRNFLDVNEPLEVNILGGDLVVSKEVQQHDDSWATLSIDTNLTTAGWAIIDTRFEPARTYRYQVFQRVHTGEAPDGNITVRRILEPRTFVVDDYEWLVFVPTSEFSLSEKILVPLVVPIVNRPELSGSEFQIGPGFSATLAAVNPRPRDGSLTGVRRLQFKVGGNLSLLRELKDSGAPADTTAGEEEKERVKLYGGFWVSLVDFVQLGVLWGVSERSDTILYVGFSLSEILGLMN